MKYSAAYMQQQASEKPKEEGGSSVSRAAVQEDQCPL